MREIRINTFRELMDLISYDWDYNYTMTMDSENNLNINKLYIEPNYAYYKTEVYKLADGLYDKAKSLYYLINESESRCPFCANPCGNEHCSYKK